MRYALLLITTALSISCVDLTRPTSSPEYLRCPASTAMTSGTDTGVSGADNSLFGSASKPSQFNCNANPSICTTLGTSYVCDTTQGCCQETPQGYCKKSADCTAPEKPVCNLAANICVACSTGAMQTEGNQQCKDWVSDHSDPLNRALCISGLCAECLTNADCTRPGKQFCNQMTNICGGCTQNSDCPGSNICKRDMSLLATGDDLTNIGDCALASDVAYVDNSYISCATGDGSQAMPYCQITDALGRAKPPSYIKVQGRGDAMVHLYKPFTVSTSGQRVAVMGPGRDAAPYSSAQAVLNGVTVTGGAQLTLMNLAVTNHVAQPAVQCNGASTLYVQGVAINDVTTPPQGGIYASMCAKVSIEKSKIAHANGYGISIVEGSGHRVVNNAIIVNGSPTDQAGLRISGGATGLFAYNTIASNKAGGIICDSAADVTDSIIIGNGPASAVSASCRPARIVTSGVTLDPAYANSPSGDPSLLQDPQNQCIDQGMADTNKTIKDDYFGSMRPQGSSYDIGFQEVR